MDKKTLRGTLCILFGGIAWGFSGANGQYLFQNYDMNANWLTVVRMLSSGILLIMLLGAKKQLRLKIFTVKKDTLRLILFALFGLMFCQYSYLVAIQYSNAGTATVLEYLAPVFVLAVFSMVNRKFPNKKELIAVSLALTGTFLLATHGNMYSLAISPQGLLWGLLAALSLTIYTLIPGNLVETYGSMLIMGLSMIIGGTVLAVITQAWTISVSLDMYGWIATAVIAIIGTVLPYTLSIQGVSDIGPVKASMLASIEPVSAAVFSALWLGTTFTIHDVIGMAAILGAVFLLTKQPKETVP